ncbi:hypothetical protein M9H77_14214 [Catharanthus roseus]|uniref:Uncharacterized protein n=1 Tax=Catharanthus roseus TaxID=4058 RepID=A0ACC0BMF0_CATRO|nr:hypothetical protein M9H77_14214 [Catharanthus roseus]
MEATHPVRVVLYWNSEYARDMYGPYFIGAAKKTWTFTRMVTHDEIVRKILKHQGMDPNLWRVRMTIRVPSFYEDMDNNDEMRYLWTIRPNISKEDAEEDDDENNDAHEDYDVSSESNNGNNPDDEEDDIITLVNPLSSTTVNQWQSSQWFSNAPYNYTQSEAFLYMDSGEQIDDLIESGIIRLLDWNDAMTDIQLGMRFVDKIQAISVV